MMYYDFKAGEQSYKLRLSTRDIVALEKVIGMNPISIFGNDGSVIPTTTTMVAILHQSLQKFQHGLTLNDAYDIFDAYIEDGHMPVEFIKDIIEIFKISGIMKDTTAQEEKETKN